MKTNPLDKVFSKLVRLRPAPRGWVCERCGKQYDSSSTGLHCSHFVGRSHRGLRWYPYNAAAHCHGCHSYLGGHPLEFSIWIDAYLSEWCENIGPNDLRILSGSTPHFKKHDLSEIQSHLKKELSRVSEMRSDGVTGRIEFTTPSPILEFIDRAK